MPTHTVQITPPCRSAAPTWSLKSLRFLYNVVMDNGISECHKSVFCDFLAEQRAYIVSLTVKKDVQGDKMSADASNTCCS